jgi:hypothetical protein
MVPARSNSPERARADRKTILKSVSRWWCLAAAFLLLVSCAACLWRGQRYRHFTTPTPIREDAVLILGFLGGREPWDNEQRAVRQLALKLRSLNKPSLLVETVENTKRSLAIQLIDNAFDRNRDGRLDERERASAKIILYGQSFGGAAVIKLARQLQSLGIPVFLTVQIDSVGRGDGIVPSNVAYAANLFQNDGWFIRGEPSIRAHDPSKTTILGNFKYGYRDKRIDISRVSWGKKAFRIAHTKMEHDPEVWAKVEELILDGIKKLR